MSVQWALTIAEAAKVRAQEARSRADDAVKRTTDLREQLIVTHARLDLSRDQMRFLDTLKEW